MWRIKVSEIPELPELVYPEVVVPDKVKEKPRKVRPWDIFNKNIDKVADVVQKERMSICLQCPRLIKSTRQCKECGCFMDAKSRLLDADCPLGKWMPVKVDENSFEYKRIVD